MSKRFDDKRKIETIIILDWIENQIGKEGFKSLSEALKENTAVVTLYLERLK